MTKHITLRLPADDPIFQYPKGDRGKKLREWIELGRNMEGTIRELNNKLESITGLAPQNPSPAVKQDIPVIVKEDIPSIKKQEGEAPGDTDRALQKALSNLMDL